MKSIAVPRNQYGKIPGVFGRSEFGAEITLAIAYQVYIVGLSFDKVCLLMNFFQHLKLRKSQANALLNQLCAAMGGGVRSAMPAAGQLAGGEYGRDGLEHQQRVGLSLREGAGVVFGDIRTRRRCGKFSIRRRSRGL